jgi:sporulation inhibitor KapD
LTERCKQFLEIRQEDVDRGIPFSQLIDVLRTFYLPESAAIVTWGNMDMLILRRSCERWGLSFPFQGKELDLSIEYMKFYGERKQTGLMKSLQQYGDIPKRQHHRALDDAFATYEIFRRIEKDKEYLMAPPKNCIGDFVDLAQLKKRLA